MALTRNDKMLVLAAVVLAASVVGGLAWWRTSGMQAETSAPQQAEQAQPQPLPVPVLPEQKTTIAATAPPQVTTTLNPSAPQQDPDSSLQTIFAETPPPPPEPEQAPTPAPAPMVDVPQVPAPPQKTKPETPAERKARLAAERKAAAEAKRAEEDARKSRQETLQRAQEELRKAEAELKRAQDQAQKAGVTLTAPHSPAPDARNACRGQARTCRKPGEAPGSNARAAGSGPIRASATSRSAQARSQA